MSLLMYWFCEDKSQTLSAAEKMISDYTMARK